MKRMLLFLLCVPGFVMTMHNGKPPQPARPRNRHASQLGKAPDSPSQRVKMQEGKQSLGAEYDQKVGRTKK